MDSVLLMAGVGVYASVLSLIRFPKGLPNNGNGDGVSVFLHANIMALCISITVLAVRMSVGPRFWRKVEKRARRALCIAMVCTAIVFNEIHLCVVRNNGNGFWMKVFATAPAILCVGFIAVFIFPK